jgi:hypothetical protein
MKFSSQSNKMMKGDRAFHDWYRFVLAYPPHLVRDILNEMKIDKEGCILDPFAGTGTTLVECQKQGYLAIGVEGCPVHSMAAKTKVNWDLDVARMRVLLDSISDDFERNLSIRSRILNLESSLLIKDSIDKASLSKCLILCESIDAVLTTLPLERGVLRAEMDFFRTALAKSATQVSSLKFAPTVGVVRPLKFDQNVLEVFRENALQALQDISELTDTQRLLPLSNCFLGDSRSIQDHLSLNCNFDALITSPPYPNECDYSRISRLESVVLGTIKDRVDLGRQKKSLIRSNTRTSYVNDKDWTFLPQGSEIFDLANSVEAKRIKRKATSNFQKAYFRVILNYFGGMMRHLRAVKPLMAPGAPLAYVVGDQASFFQTHIKTGRLLAALAEQAGYQVEGIELFRQRSTATGSVVLAEEVVLMRKPK